MKHIYVFHIFFLITETCGFLESLLPKLSDPLLSGFFSTTKTAVPICPESENKLQSFFHVVNNASVVEVKPPSEMEIAVCKNIFTENFQNEGNCGTFDFSYIVAIKSRRNGEPKLTTVGQGILLEDCTIATIYTCTQFGEGLWVTFQNGNTFEVVCIKEAQLGLNNLLGTIYLVQLVIDAPCCKSLVTAFPKFADSTIAISAEIIDGYLISHDCSSCNLSLNPIRSVLVSATANLGITSVELKVAIPSDPDALCKPFFGGVPFIDKNGVVHGIAFLRPALLVGVLFDVPVVNEIDVACTVPMVPPIFDCSV